MAGIGDGLGSAMLYLLRMSFVNFLWRRWIPLSNLARLNSIHNM